MNKVSLLEVDINGRILAGFGGACPDSGFRGFCPFLSFLFAFHLLINKLAYLSKQHGSTR